MYFILFVLFWKFPWKLTKVMHLVLRHPLGIHSVMLATDKQGFPVRFCCYRVRPSSGCWNSWLGRRSFAGAWRHTWTSTSMAAQSPGVRRSLLYDMVKHFVWAGTSGMRSVVQSRVRLTWLPWWTLGLSSWASPSSPWRGTIAVPKPNHPRKRHLHDGQLLPHL